MKTHTKRFLITLGLLLGASSAVAQGTAFTYQGRFLDGANPANGRYDLRFNLYDAVTAGSQLGTSITNPAVVVSNGLFTVTVDFGAGVFTGSSRFVEVAARSNTVAVAFTVLSPRQQLTPTPYAITAENLYGSLPAGQLTGTLPSGVLCGIYGCAITFNNPGDSFTGDGSGLTGLNASTLATGTVPDARLSPNVALLNGNQTFTGVNTFASGGSAGRLIVSNTYVAVDTNQFTGLSLQYDGTQGEGAIMSAYNGGEGFLSFYTKPSGYPVAKQMAIDWYGNVGIDQGNHNDGFLNNNSLAGAGLTFGASSGEGLASKRTAGGNQHGLDFYTGFSNRMSILNNGQVGIQTSTPSETLEINGTARTDEYDVYFRKGTDRNHGIGYRATVNGGAISVDGPFLYGFNGGCLGLGNPDYAALTWSWVGNVWISNDCSVASLSCRGAGSFNGNVTVGGNTTFAGHVGIGGANPTNLLVVGSSGAPAYCNGTTWVNGSDRDSKQDFAPVDPEEVLAKVDSLPVKSWCYKAQPGDRHIGPVAQDFHAAFELNGGDDKHIATVDEGGVALAAIQGLNRKLNQKDAEIADLKARLEKLEQLFKAKSIGAN